tara:strand:+ start:317 stop:1003 length:687 start_codon:yes stop_codon:yes gene_type:complete
MAYTLANLRTDIKNFTEVDSTVFSDSVLDRLIQNAENKIYRAVDSDADRFYATSTTTNGNRYVTIPSDLRIIRYVQITNSTVTPNIHEFLEQRDTSFMAEYYNTPNTANGLPKYYANWDANFWVLAPTPNATYTITMAYIKQPTSLTDSSVSNTGTYLSNKYQDLLLYGSLVEAYGYLKGPIDMLQYYKGQYDKSLETYAIEQQGRRRRGEYEDGVIRTPLKSLNPSQ